MIDLIYITNFYKVIYQLIYKAATTRELQLLQENFMEQQEKQQNQVECSKQINTSTKVTHINDFMLRVIILYPTKINFTFYYLQIKWVYIVPHMCISINHVIKYQDFSPHLLLN